MSHIIVIFDCSGSMGEPFQALKKTRKRKYLQHEIKIEAAKSSLMDWLQKSEFNTVTIIPFSSKIKRKLTVSLKNLTRVHSYIYGQNAGGDTNLQAAISRAIKVALKDIENSYIQYLIVTDGLSHTVEQDIKLVQTIPASQGVSGILIDPTADGEYHLRQLCVRGSYMSVTGFREFTNIFGNQDKTYTERVRLSKSVSQLKKKNNEVAEKLINSERQIKSYPRLQKEFEKIISASTRKIKEIRENEQAITNKIADQNIDVPQITYDIYKAEQEQADLEAIVDLLAKYDQLLQQLKIFVSHPRFLAKGHTTTLFIHIYPANNQIKDLNREIRKLGAAKGLYNTVLTIGMNATTKLECQEMQFSSEITKKFSKGKNVLKFTVKPEDSSKPSLHEFVLVIYNQKTGKEYVSHKIRLELIDFAFGRTSFPRVIRWATILFSLISLAVIACVTLGAISIPTGTLVGVIAGTFTITGLTLYIRNFRVYNSVK